jgi:hypothetical protein
MIPAFASASYYYPKQKMNCIRKYGLHTKNNIKTHSKLIELMNLEKKTHNSCFDSWNFSGIIVSHHVFLKPKTERLRTPAISKWNVTG